MRIDRGFFYIHPGHRVLLKMACNKLNYAIMKINKLSLALILTICCFYSANAQQNFNGSFEKTDAASQPAGWLFNFNPDQLKAYSISLDSTEKLDGRYSLRIARTGNGTEFAAVDFPIPYTYTGKTIKLKGSVKTENVSGGYAGLWLRIDGTEEFYNMSDKGIKGSTDWSEYTIELPYNMNKASSIHLGALLVGQGTMWVDKLSLSIDNKSIDQAVVKPIVLAKALSDKAFENGSGIDTVILSRQQMINLDLLGQVWGFIKYHHPSVAKGDINMDAELFRVLPAVLQAGNNVELSTALETWVDKFGSLPLCKNCKTIPTHNVYIKPDYGHILDSSVLSASLSSKLQNILDNKTFNSHYYIDMVSNIGNPIFSNEEAYTKMKYPDAGYRLLGLYRYWNMIQYFFPYKPLIGENWNGMLQKYLPKFAGAADETQYLLANLELIANIHDTHANIWSNHTSLELYKGRFVLPLQAKFVEEKLVVTGYYADSLKLDQQVKRGAVITAINGVKIPDLIKKYLPLTAASNYSTQLRDLPRYYLMRSQLEENILSFEDEGKAFSLTIKGVNPYQLKPVLTEINDPKSPGYKVIENGQIGYVYPAKYKNTDLPALEKLFASTKGIIVDMRCYPSDFMPFTFVPYIKQGSASFVKFTFGSVLTPGLFSVGKPLMVKGRHQYKGKVIVIVNELSQSQAEYTTMAFQASPNVTVIGSTTAGADGNVSSIYLPGGIRTMISGISVLYPDGTQTQRKGVHIDHVIPPTINGIKSGKDELLLKATELLLK
jgi:hypothetical protein